jgi:ferredoxin
MRHEYYSREIDCILCLALCFKSKGFYPKRVSMKRFPVVDIGRCTKCGGCMSVAPEVFRFNDPLGYVEVIDMEAFPVELVDEAIKLCPVDCISWDEE